MKLNHDCIRDVLLCIEEVALINADLSYSETKLETIYQMLPQYDKEDIYYTIVKLDEGSYINALIIPLPNGGIKYSQINALTWKGHELLDSIRPESVWSRIKDASSRAGGFSIKTISYLGGLIANNYVEGLNLAEIAKECFK